MSAALLAAAAAWLAVPAPATRRLHGLRDETSVDRGPTPRQWLLLIVPVLCVLVLGPLSGAVAAVVVTPVAVGVIGGLETSAARRRAQLMRQQVPRALDLMAAVLEAGRDPGTTFSVVAEVTPEPLSSELRVVATRLGTGSHPSDVWALLVDHGELSPVGRAFRRAAESGVSVAQVIGQAADDARRQRRAAARARSRAVGVRTAVPLGVCFLPAFFCVGIGPTLIGLFGSLDVLP